MIRKIVAVSLLVLLAITGVSNACGHRHRTFQLRKHVAETLEQSKSDQDLLRVYVSYARQDGDKFVVCVAAVWGDLDRKIDGIGPEYYSNWDGFITVDGGTVALVGKLFFDDRSGKEPAEGSGVDKLGEQTDTRIDWQAAVVGATDGLKFKLVFDSLDSSATVQAGGLTVTINPTMAPATTPAEPEGPAGESEQQEVERL